MFIIPHLRCIFGSTPECRPSGGYIKSKLNFWNPTRCSVPLFFFLVRVWTIYANAAAAAQARPAFQNSHKKDMPYHTIPWLAGPVARVIVGRSWWRMCSHKSWPAKKAYSHVHEWIPNYNINTVIANPSGWRNSEERKVDLSAAVCILA